MTTARERDIRKLQRIANIQERADSVWRTDSWADPRRMKRARRLSKQWKRLLEIRDLRLKAYMARNDGRMP